MRVPPAMGILGIGRVQGGRATHCRHTEIEGLIGQGKRPEPLLLAVAVPAQRPTRIAAGGGNAKW